VIVRFRGWLRELAPLEPPVIRAIKIEGVINDFGTVEHTALLEFSPLENPPVSPNFLISGLPLFPEDFSLSGFEAGPLDESYVSLAQPEAMVVPFPVIDDVPGNLDVLEVLGFPAVAGKAYGKDALREEEQLELPVSRDAVDRSLCRHGIPRYACEICLQEQERKLSPAKPRAVKIKTIDVFELLLPYLQPPFEHMLDQPLLFPPDRRPYPYQVEGIRFLLENTNALLGDEMGLGKTIQAILATRILIRRGKIRNVLVLCPLSLLGNWEREIKKWAPELFVMKIRGMKEVREWQWKAKAAVYLTTYETLRMDVENALVLGSAFDLAVLDEVQRIKNPEAGVSRAVRTLGPTYRWGLSGTPLENKIEDVIAIFRFLRPGTFAKGYDRKEDTSFSLVTIHSSTFDKQAGLSTQMVRQAIKPYFLRRRLKDVLKELPEKRVTEVWLDLNDQQRATYDQELADARKTLSKPGVTRIHIFQLINTLKQICNIDPDTGDSCKLDYLDDQLEEILENGYKALVFSQFPQKTLVAAKDRLRHYEPEIFYGGLSEQQRERLLDSFQKNEDPKVLLASVQAAGIGLNLTRANHVFHFDHWWNPAVARQAEARAWRIGQQETVFVHDMYTNDTIEERVHRILASKQALFNEVIDDLSSEVNMKAFTDEELFSMFDMKPPEGGIAGTTLRPPQQSTSTTLGQMRSLSPAQFEQLIARYFEKLGFKVDIVGGPHDQGVDLLARRASDIGLERLAIQCKHYPDGQVGPSLIRELIGARSSHPEATRVVMVTSGTISPEATRLAERNRIDLIDGTFLRVLVEKYQVNIQGGR